MFLFSQRLPWWLFLCHLQTTLHPKHRGITKVLFFKAGPCASCWAGPAVLQGRGGKLLRACRPPPPGQPFEGVITVACITWVTADAGWSHLMKPLKNSPFHAWFLLKFCSGGSRPGSQTAGLPCAAARGHCLITFHRVGSHYLLQDKMSIHSPF